MNVSLHMEQLKTLYSMYKIDSVFDVIWHTHSGMLLNVGTKRFLCFYLIVILLFMLMSHNVVYMHISL